MLSKMGGYLMWYVIKILLLLGQTALFMVLGVMNSIPSTVAIICAAGTFACVGLSIAQMFTEDL